MQQESPAANARGLGLDQIQHPLRRNRCIQGSATKLEDFDGGFRSMPVGRDGHVRLTANRRLRQKATGRLRLQGLARCDEWP